MKKGLLTIGVFAFLAIGMVSCESSKKGAWTDSDKEAARDEIKGDITDKAVQDCIISSLEKEYDSYYDANSDESEKNTEKLTNLMMDCMTK
ncbi:MAG: hypothetical protein CL824_03915 [Crocinitomicaceae bacterium]|nr:hypothetical protein [Crocinitomicaceae bacterium]|tara:strand:- start:94 stop:366 length:273 start_codon:yes stop_codon:yes gene_type:complete